VVGSGGVKLWRLEEVKVGGSLAVGGGAGGLLEEGEADGGRRQARGEAWAHSSSSYRNFSSPLSAASNIRAALFFFVSFGTFHSTPYMLLFSFSFPLEPSTPHMEWTGST
jgi:hypothetical protein